jgi:uncharacterized protein YoxC
MYLDMGYLMLGVIFLLLLGFSIAIFLRIWQAVKNITVTLEALNSRLPVILKNLEEITTNINESTTSINQEVQRFSTAARRVNEMVSGVVDDFRSITPSALKIPLFAKVRNTIAMVRGVRVFLDVFLNKKKI